MIFKYPKFKYAVFLMILTALFTSIITAQKKPAAINLDTNNDDDRLCGYSSADATNIKLDKNSNADLRQSQFCNLYSVYVQNKFSADEGNRRIAKNARNEMVELVLGQVDSYYKFRKGDRRKKVNWFQTILDFLEVGGATAIAIMNGERAKTVVGAAIAGLQGGRTRFDQNFKILQTQALINKMNEKRSRLKIAIIAKMSQPISADSYANGYSWMSAKNDLRDYLIAGTFEDALDSLVEDTGARADLAERELRKVEKRPIINEASESDLKRTLSVRDTLGILEKKLAGTDDEKAAATKALRIVLADLNNTEKFKQFFTGKGIAAQSEGSKIYDAIRGLMLQFADDDDASTVIEKAIIKNGGIE